MTPTEGFRLALGTISLAAAVYSLRRGRRAFNRFFAVWLVLVIATIIVGEIFIRMGWPGAFLFKF